MVDKSDDMDARNIAANGEAKGNRQGFGSTMFGSKPAKKILMKKPEVSRAAFLFFLKKGGYESCRRALNGALLLRLQHGKKLGDGN